MSTDIEVIVHPLVLLSTVDHYNRVVKGTQKRVVGVLLGSRSKGVLDITNSFALPFEENANNLSIWYLDHGYLESMFGMFRKINAKEKIVGFYSTGPRIKENDIEIERLFREMFCPNPVFVIIDVRPNVEGIPTRAYVTVEEVEAEGKEIQRTFKHVPSSIGALEAEEVGVEHLLRDINDPSVSTLANQIKLKMQGLAGLQEHLLEIKQYLENVINGKLPINNQVIYNLQDIFNLLPNLNLDEMIRSMVVKMNDMHLVIYISALIRCIIALHNLVNNQIQFKNIDSLEASTQEAKAKNGEEKTAASKENDSPRMEVDKK